MGPLSLDSVHVDELLHRAVDAGCRELRLRTGQPPETQGCDGEPQDALTRYEPLSPLHMQQIVYAIMTDEQIRQLERDEALDFSYPLSQKATFDIHVVLSKGGPVEADFRRSPDQ